MSFERSCAVHETIPELSKWLYKKSAGITHRFKHSSRSSISDTLTGNGSKMNLEKAISDKGNGPNNQIKQEFPELSTLRVKWKSFMPTKQSPGKDGQRHGLGQAAPRPPALVHSSSAIRGG